MTGLIFDIRRYSVHDGPGIRTTVFLKGCPLRCRWCHNPEGLLGEPQVIRRRRSLDGKVTGYTETIGRWASAGEVVNDILRDSLFFEESGGGATFSGGEPLMQPEFLLEALSLCRQAGIHTAVDTSGYAEIGVFTEVARNADLLLLDIKSADTEVHTAHTGQGNELVLGNLASLKDGGTPVILRIPVIPSVNDDRASMIAIRDLALELQPAVVRVDLLPWHRLGHDKYRSLGMQSPPLFAPPAGMTKLKNIASIFASAGFIVKEGG